MHEGGAKQHPASTASDGELVRARRALGDLELILCSDGTYLLDGGAMFGVVPKPMWEKRAPADEQNRILLGLNTVVVRTGGAVVVIETGIGNKQPAKMREIFQNQERLPASLAAAGVRAGRGDARGEYASALRSLRMEYDAEGGWGFAADVSECAVLCGGRGVGAWAAAAGSRSGELSFAELRSADCEWAA